MKCDTLVPAVFVAAALLAGSAQPASAQRRGGSRGGSSAGGAAVPRAGAPRTAGRPVHVSPRVVPYRSYYYPYRPVFSLGIYGGYPFGSYPYAYGPYGYAPYGYGLYGYPPYAYGGYGYGAYGYQGSAYGAVRIQGAPRNAQVFVDGYYVGVVDDFDGTFQHLNLEPGAHQIEIRPSGARPLAFEVRIEPGQTITYHATPEP